jgi:hypothetical protein
MLINTLQLEWELKVCHTYRETNRCVDVFARVGCEFGSSVNFYELYLTQITHIFLDDKAETNIFRLTML